MSFASKKALLSIKKRQKAAFLVSVQTVSRDVSKASA
jgi:hypothetical protein